MPEKALFLYWLTVPTHREALVPLVQLMAHIFFKSLPSAFKD